MTVDVIFGEGVGIERVARHTMRLSERKLCKAGYQNSREGGRNPQRCAHVPTLNWLGGVREERRSDQQGTPYILPHHFRRAD
jgi:hypothetical protein